VEFNFSGKMTLEDFIQINKFHRRKSFSYKFVYVFYIIIFGYLLKEIIFLIKNNIEFYDLKEIITGAYFLTQIVVLVFLALVLIVSNKIILPKACRKYFNSNKLYTEVNNFKINENEISVNSESTNQVLTRDKILKILYDKDSIYVYVALNMTHIIKARYLENANQFDELCNFLKNNYGKK